ncbi:MAG: ABC transporter ATP-binding protein [Weeksellaceae bacterium]|nr:ABC transporter ATP-binding protein [Weeksellaceae bacterium]
MIKAHNIYKNFGELEVLKGVSLEVAPREIVSIVGASGAGKTTLLQILGTLDRTSDPQKHNSSLIINGEDVTRLNDSKLSAFRNQQIGFIFQFHQLLPEFTALENVCIPGMIQGKSMATMHKKGLELMSFFGLKDRTGHKPSQLSGGEQQRVAVARALINDPSVVFADEPSGNLDSRNATELHQLFLRLRDELGQTFVVVTHNKELAELADRKLTMVDGNISL